ncbi:MAG: hypothetical protein HYZ93_05440 [Candidatus Omnitrophica bacterium]|nr:hypothetical protein [Candidatus Omnitrophota bacterium]
MRSLPAALAAALLLCPTSLRAEQAASLQQRIDAIEKSDLELEKLTRELRSAKGPSERRRLEARIQKLKLEQEEMLRALEKILGPQPPAVPSEQPVPLEDQLKLRERRRDTTLDNNAERRLSK